MMLTGVNRQVQAQMNTRPKAGLRGSRRRHEGTKARQRAGRGGAVDATFCVRVGGKFRGCHSSMPVCVRAHQVGWILVRSEWAKQEQIHLTAVAHLTHDCVLTTFGDPNVFRKLPPHDILWRNKEIICFCPSITLCKLQPHLMKIGV